MLMARGLLRWSVKDLAKAANLGTTTIFRMETKLGVPNTTVAVNNAVLETIKLALEGIGAELIYENGGGLGVRLNKVRNRVKGLRGVEWQNC